MNVPCEWHGPLIPSPLTFLLCIVPSPSQFGISDLSTAAAFRIGFTTTAQSVAENQFRHYARKHFDVYAMLLPYSVTVDMRGIPATKVESSDGEMNKEVAITKWPEVTMAERRLFGKRTAEVDGLEVTSETLQGTFVVSTHCMAHFCTNQSAMWIVDLSTDKAAGEITSDGVIDHSGKAEIVVCLGDYASADALPSILQDDIANTLANSHQINVSYVPHIQ